jgi:hypothetical protein
VITNVPTAADFFAAGRELFDFAWDVIAQLLKNLDEAKTLGTEPAEVSESYWLSAKRRLTTALSITQQGVEFCLKGKIVEVSPYLLLSDPPSKWPSPYGGSSVDFSSFRTIDAQDLIRVHDTFAPVHLAHDLTTRFHELREKRNRIMHSVDKKITVHATEAIDALLFMHKSLFPGESWSSVRRSLLETAPESELGGRDFVVNVICWELDLVLELLTPAQVHAHFAIDKKQRRYMCPECYSEANRDADFEHKLAVLQPKGANSTALYCLVCNCTYQVKRQKCTHPGCPGNVISEDGLCLTCCRWS